MISSFRDLIFGCPVLDTFKTSDFYRLGDQHFWNSSLVASASGWTIKSCGSLGTLKNSWSTDFMGATLIRSSLPDSYLQEFSEHMHLVRNAFNLLSVNTHISTQRWERCPPFFRQDDPEPTIICFFILLSHSWSLKEIALQGVWRAGSLIEQ